LQGEFFPEEVTKKSHYILTTRDQIASDPHKTLCALHCAW